ncbi:chloride channel protein [Salidesulfovibrio onnuriiensis]|uniref:chloride channel protein n=1 Tax=Salidesulfovibrio onnuriiensis TaxID=2583823 RepID=UPI0011C9826F|nr:chloride channel protein [Salidesulfovibrio onnuriiensis]
MQDAKSSFADRIRSNKNLNHLMLAIIIGVLAGYGAVLFKFVLKSMQWIFYQHAGDFLAYSSEVPTWSKIVMPAVGGLIVGLVVHFFAREAKGHGVPEVMQAIALRAGVIRKRVAAAKIFASAVTIGSGGSVGREGPMVQIGSSIGSSIGQLFKVPTIHMKTMIGCGAAAGIAATFNAPIAGVLFALEIIVGDWGVTSFSPVVLASVTATSISRYYFGDFPAFVIPDYNVVSLWEFCFYPFLGIATGLVGLSFTKILYAFEDASDAVKIVPEWFKPAIGGALLGIVVIFFPQSFGVGYGAMNLSLTNNMGFWMLFTLIWVKILASSITLGSGGSGGIFAPSLFIGAMTGGAFGSLVHTLFPGITADPGAYALVAMGGVVAGTTYAPITAILIIFEMTGKYSIILPLMLTCITATVLNSTINRASIYTTKLLRRGIDIEAGRERNILQYMLVKEIMTTDIIKIPESATLERILWAFKTHNAPYLHVVDEEDNLTGIISFRDIRPVLYEEDLLQLVIAKDLATTSLETVTGSDTLQTALDRMTDKGVSQLPVLKSESSSRLIGTLTEHALNTAYNQQLLRKEIDEEE